MLPRVRSTPRALPAPTSTPPTNTERPWRRSNAAARRCLGATTARPSITHSTPTNGPRRQPAWRPTSGPWVRSEAEHALATVEATIRQLDATLRAAPAARAGSDILERARLTLHAAEEAAQESRSAVVSENYLTARDATCGLAEQLREADCPARHRDCQAATGHAAERHTTRLTAAQVREICGDRRTHSAQSLHSTADASRHGRRGLHGGSNTPGILRPPAFLGRPRLWPSFSGASVPRSTCTTAPS